jgi:hypothetical protein
MQVSTRAAQRHPRQHTSCRVPQHQEQEQSADTFAFSQQPSCQAAAAAAAVGIAMGPSTALRAPVSNHQGGGPAASAWPLATWAWLSAAAAAGASQPCGPLRHTGELFCPPYVALARHDPSKDPM